MSKLSHHGCPISLIILKPPWVAFYPPESPVCMKSALHKHQDCCDPFPPDGKHYRIPFEWGDFSTPDLRLVSPASTSSLYHTSGQVSPGLSGGPHLARLCLHSSVAICIYLAFKGKLSFRPWCKYGTLETILAWEPMLSGIGLQGLLRSPGLGDTDHMMGLRIFFQIYNVLS